MEKEKNQQSLELEAHSNDLQDWFCAWHWISYQDALWERGKEYDRKLLKFDVDYRLPLPCDSLIRLGLSHKGIGVWNIEYSSPYRCKLSIWFYGDGSLEEDLNAFEKVKSFFGKSVDVGPRPTEMW